MKNKYLYTHSLQIYFIIYEFNHFYITLTAQGERYLNQLIKFNDLKNSIKHFKVQKLALASNLVLYNIFVPFCYIQKG